MPGIPDETRGPLDTAVARDYEERGHGPWPTSGMSWARVSWAHFPHAQHSLTTTLDTHSTHTQHTLNTALNTHSTRRQNHWFSEGNH